MMSEEKRRMIKATETLILHESFELCPYLRAMQKESKRNAEVKDAGRSMEEEMEMDIPEATRLKAHLKRRVERQSKAKWVQYATEYASEITLAGPVEKDAMRRYMEMTREAVMEMNRKDRKKKKDSRERKHRAANIAFNEETY